MAKPRQVLVPGYEIVGELGRGGMGVVYKARQIGLNRWVALKMVLAAAHASQHQLDRFLTEAKAVAGLQHPNIVQIYENGEHDGLPFFSLEFVGGGSLDAKVHRKPQPPREAAHTVETLAEAMHYAHEHGVIHRDLKPANILLTVDGIPKITDFGLAKRLAEDTGQTKSGTLMGTPNYMAPEQARGEVQDVGPLADVYTLGAILYELLTGRPPFQGATVLETVKQVTNDEPLSPTRLQPHVPRDLETICLKCLQKDMGKRYGSARLLADDLRRFLSDEPILARPVSNWERLARWCRRNPRVATLSACVAVLLLVAMSAAIAIYRNLARDAETVAEAGKIADQRYEQALIDVKTGHHLQAQGLLHLHDHVLASAPGLRLLRSKIDTLRNQVDDYVELKKLSDNVHFACRMGGQAQKGREYCLQFLNLFEQVSTKTGDHTWGLPPLDEEQEQLFNEDVFDVFLDAAQVEVSLATGATAEVCKAADLKAIEWLNRAEQILPNTKVVCVRRAGSWERLGNQKEFQADMTKAGSIKPTSAVEHYWHGYAHHLRALNARQQNNGQKAAEYFRQEIMEYAAFLEMRPEHFWGYFNWALCHAELGNTHDALIGFTACIRLRPDFPWPYNNRGTLHLRLGEYQQAVQDYTQALTLDPEYLAAYTGRALAHRSLGKRDLALNDLSRALHIDERHAHALENRADLQIELKDYQKAHDDLSALLKLRPDNVELLRKRADLTLANLKDPEGSLVDWNHLVQLRPKDHEFLYFSGVVHAGLRRYGAALANLERALQLRPDYLQAVWARAQVYFWQGNLVKALEIIEPWSRKESPQLADTLNIRGDILRALDRPEDAIRAYRGVIQLNPKDPDAYIGLALVYGKQGNWDLARKCYDDLLSADKKSGTAYLRRAEFLRSRGHFTDALSDCTQAARLLGGSCLPELVRSSILAAQGQHQEAIKAAESVLKGAPKDDGPVLYAAAAVWSLAASSAQRDTDSKSRDLSNNYLSRAVLLLQQAFDKGFHDFSYQEHNRMLDDPALAAVCLDPTGHDLLAHKGK
ncbi:MAG TPA: tetratricopeptide repeat protein [Gemmataceae bacterium]|nr:tetratricopeptide repeat protein [Gemmataceae bacterium]